MKKIAFLILCVVIAIIIDGSMTYEIFNSRSETLTGWLMAIIAALLVLVIWVADTSKKNDNQNN